MTDSPDEEFQATLARKRAEHARLSQQLAALEAAEQRATEEARALNAALTARRDRTAAALVELDGRLSALASGQAAALSAQLQRRKGLHLMLRLALTAGAFTTSMFFASVDGRGAWLVPVLLAQGAAVWWLGDLADREALK